MNFQFIKLTFLLLVTGFLSSCLPTDPTTTLSSDASFVSLTLSGNDSVKTAKFTLNADGITIENKDSLPFQTRIDSVYTTISFKSSSGAKWYFPKDVYKFKKDSSSVLSKDTIDFRRPIDVLNHASDGKTPKRYTIKLNVHKVEPELYVWSNIIDNINSISTVSSKTVIMNDTFFYFQNDGVKSYLSTSANGKSWSSPAENIIPADAILENMLTYNGKIYLLSHNKIYTSSDGTSWNIATCTPFVNNYQSIICGLNDSIYGVLESNSKYYIGSSKDGILWKTLINLPVNFPVSSFASITLQTVTQKSKSVVLGGYSKENALLRNCWSTENGYYWIDFSTENRSLDSLDAGASVISYDKKLLLYGKYSTLDKSFYKESVDEGFSWRTPNLKYNQIRQGFSQKSIKTAKDTIIYVNYLPHSKQSVVVDKNSNIYLVGGLVNKSMVSVRGFNTRQQYFGQTPTYVPSSDVWTGKLNRLSFPK